MNTNKKKYCIARGGSSFIPKAFGELAQRYRPVPYYRSEFIGVRLVEILSEDD